MQERRLGSQGLAVSTIGLGCMVMSEFGAAGSKKDAIATIRRALELGVNFLDTADIYGPLSNERLVGQAIRDRREQMILSSKFGIELGNNPGYQRINGRPEYVRNACEGSLRRLGVDYIDLYCQHRVDPHVPIEETVGAMSDLVTSGKVRYLGLSEAAPQTIRRAHVVHPISAVQSEYSLWSRDPELEVLSTLRELKIGFIAYSPLGRGFLTGKIKSTDDLSSNDYRRNWPRFEGSNFIRNFSLVRHLIEIANAKSIHPAQLSLAWVLAQGKDIVALMGTQRSTHLEENIAALSIILSKKELNEIDKMMPCGVAKGTRYPEVMMRTLNL